ncbi:MAG TPA: DNA-3-methyladenine glycosylase [Candidatus Omnitrophota bacterium]|nr:DNA-3-methyladenine glycosylase [Candidatus Omnitrophota bacterium]
MKPTAAPSARRLRFGPPLPPAYYDRATELVARELLGAVLQSRSPDGVTSGRIVETEAYLGPHDPACHAVAGLTERTRALHGPPGTAYVYFVYGVHWCMNAVTREAGHGSAVLIRALEPLEGLALMRRRRGERISDRDLANGPGKLCQALGIDRRLDGVRLDRGALRILRGDALPDEVVRATPRIGISRAADWPLRFVVASSPYLSRRI